jgi:hypothetical protein
MGQPLFQREWNFMDAAVEHPAVASAGFFPRMFMLFEDQQADRHRPAPTHEFSGNRAADNTGADNANIIRVHRIFPRGLETSFRRSRKT